MAASGKTSFAEALANEMEGVKTDLSFDVGRQCYGEGLGILARGYDTTSQTAMHVVNQFSKPGSNGARYMSVGQKVEVGSAGTPSALTPLAAGYAINSITVAQNSGTLYDIVSISNTSDMTVNSYIFNNQAGGTGIELKGLRCIVDDTTATNIYNFSAGMFNASSIFNVDRGAVKGWNATVSQNSGTERILDSYLMQRTLSQVKKASGKEVDIFFAEYDTIDAFWDSVAGDRRFNSKNFDAGVETLTFNGKTMVKDLLAPYNEMFCLNKEAIKWYVLKDFGFDDMSGEVLKNVAGYDRHEAFIKAYLQIAPGEMAAPNSCGVIRDIKTRL
jgi:hypothetical protein